MQDLCDELHLQTQLRALQRDWRFVGNLPQQPPKGDWRTWLLIGGRGSGKTRAGAEWIHAVASSGRQSELRIALVAETLGDAREVMIDGISGICRIARRRRPLFRSVAASPSLAEWRGGAGVFLGRPGKPARAAVSYGLGG